MFFQYLSSGAIVSNSQNPLITYSCTRVLHWASFQSLLFFSQTFNIGNAHQDECQTPQLTCQVWKNEYSRNTSQIEEEPNLHITAPTEQIIRFQKAILSKHLFY